jgi:lipopolysaccharide export LptBFGC system permease protein LptF
VKKNNFIKNQFLTIIKTVSILSLLLGSILFILNLFSYPDGAQRNFLQVINQAINTSSETSENKVNTKLLQDSFSDYFYSYDDCSKKFSYLKIFTIISETSSEQNIRYSSFLLKQITTST